MAGHRPEMAPLPAELRPRGGIARKVSCDGSPGLMLRGATLADGSEADLRIVGGRIASVLACGQLEAVAGDEVCDLRGYLLLPAMADPHAHLDKAFTASRAADSDGDIVEAIDFWQSHQRTVSVRDIAERARAAALLALRNGTTAIRAQVDIDEGIGLRGIDALLRVREELREEIEIQIVAFAFPLFESVRPANFRLLKEALEMGADVVGGAPHIDLDPAAHLRDCIDVAAEWGRPLDLHMDEHTDPERLDLGAMARAVAGGEVPGAVASHCVSLASQPTAVQERVSDEVAAAGIGVVTLPQTDLYQQGRGVEARQPRGLTALAALRRAGVPVAAGGDHIQDPFSPLGCCDPLQTAQLLVAAAQVSPTQAYAMVSTEARRLLGLEPVRVEPGALADLVAIAGGSIQEVVATASPERIVIRSGRVRASTLVVSECRGRRRATPVGIEGEVAQ